jgi:hypothetical protein
MKVSYTLITVDIARGSPDVGHSSMRKAQLLNENYIN